MVNLKKVENALREAVVSIQQLTQRLVSSTFTVTGSVAISGSASISSIAGTVNVNLSSNALTTPLDTADRRLLLTQSNAIFTSDYVGRMT